LIRGTRAKDERGGGEVGVPALLKDRIFVDAHGCISLTQYRNDRMVTASKGDARGWAHCDESSTLVFISSLSPVPNPPKLVLCLMRSDGTSSLFRR
jgi:hypothetical protein